MEAFGVIFDVDGVLIDSVEAAYRVRSRVLAAHGVNLAAVPDPHNEDHKGNSLRSLLDAVRSHTGVALDEEEIAKELLKRMSEAFKGVRPDADLVSFLDELKRHDVPCAIGSGGRTEGVITKLNILGIRDYFSLIVSAQDITSHKPAPEIYQLVAARLGLSTGRCVVIEDSVAGVQAAKAAGCTVVGFSGFNQNKQPIPGTSLTIDRCSDLSLARLYLSMLGLDQGHEERYL